MGSLSIEEFDSFFAGLRRLAEEQAEASDGFFRDFERIRAHLTALKEKTLAEGLTAAPEFNVFHLLGLSRSEVRTHSAMLAHLFKPEEIHGQRTLFLKSFLDYCHQKDPSFPCPKGELETAHWQVYTEHVTQTYGRMDIVVRSPDLGFIAVIENKVDAGEQLNQLDKYGMWLEDQKRVYPDQLLIFLTLLGTKAYSAKETRYLPLSYHEDIPDWLSGILSQIQAPNVRNVIAQYINLVRSL